MSVTDVSEITHKDCFTPSDKYYQLSDLGRIEDLKYLKQLLLTYTLNTRDALCIIMWSDIDCGVSSLIAVFRVIGDHALV